MGGGELYDGLIKTAGVYRQWNEGGEFFMLKHGGLLEGILTHERERERG
jgi:hypothetical protein